MSSSDCPPTYLESPVTNTITRLRLTYETASMQLVVILSKASLVAVCNDPSTDEMESSKADEAAVVSAEPDIRTNANQI